MPRDYRKKAKSISRSLAGTVSRGARFAGRAYAEEARRGAKKGRELAKKGAKSYWDWSAKMAESSSENRQEPMVGFGLGLDEPEASGWQMDADDWGFGFNADEPGAMSGFEADEDEFDWTGWL